MKTKTKLISGFCLAIVICLFLPEDTFASSFALSGKVTDSAGSAVAGVTISVNDSNNDSTTTDNAGNYNMSIPEGTYDIQVTPPLGSEYSQVLYANKTILSDTTVNFILVNSQQVTLSGHIYDSSGNPLQNVKVKMYASNGAIYEVTTDSSGNYSSPPVIPGSYAIAISGGNDDPAVDIPQIYEIHTSLIYSGTFPYSLTQDTIQDFYLPFKRINLHVQDAASNPVSGVRITSRGVTDTIYGNFYLGNTSFYTNYSDQQSSVTTDSSGNVTLWSLPMTKYTITATPFDGSVYTTTITNISVTGDMNKAITMNSQQVTLSGHIYDSSGNPLQNVKIMLYNENNVSHEATTDSSGNYSSPPVIPGSYAIAISGGNDDPAVDIPQIYYIHTYSVGGAHPYNLTQDTIQDFYLPFKRINLHVQDAASNPVSGASITSNGSGILYYDLGNTSFYTGYVYQQSSVTTDSSGNVTLWSPPVANYTITVTPPDGSDYLVTNSTISVSNDIDATVTMNSQQVTLSGHIYDSSGNPLQNVKVKMYASNGAIYEVTTDASGSYFLPPVIPGSYAIAISGTNDNTAANISQTYEIHTSLIYSGTFPYSLIQDTIQDFYLPFKRISLHVQDAANNPVSGVSITARGSSSSVTGNYYLGNTSFYTNYSDQQSPTTTDPSGNVTLWSLPAQNYTITATPPDGSAYLVINSTISVSDDMDEVISLQFVHDPPITTANLSPAPNPDELYQDPTIISLTATAVSGYSIANTYYIVDGSARQEYTTPFTVTGSSDHTVTYWSVDNLGVTELPNNKTFTINTNQAPTLNPIGNKTVDEGQLLQFTISASDPDGNSLSYSATNLPQGASFDANTRTFSWTPDYGQAGNYNNIEFTVMDNGSPMALDVEIITITVGDVNRPPVFTNLPGPQAILSGSNLTFLVSASDPDNDAITLSATNLPLGASFDSNAGLFYWVPTASQEGQYVITFTATDNGTPSEYVSLDVLITVGHNPTPVELADELVNDIVAYDFPTNVENSYLANLQKVAIFIEQGKIQAAINQLEAFIQKLNQDYAQGIITLSQRDYYDAKAQHLIDVLNGS